MPKDAEEPLAKIPDVSDAGVSVSWSEEEKKELGIADLPELGLPFVSPVYATAQ